MRAVLKVDMDQDANKFQLFLFLPCSYDRSKYVGRDEDDRNMEADYASILKEERRRYTTGLIFS
jgi:hypothetical protein